MSATPLLQARFEAALMPTYGVPPLALTRGEGCKVWDADGREYTDLIAASRSARLATPTRRSSRR
jgi:acetylornithine aminotransferase